MYEVCMYVDYARLQDLLRKQLTNKNKYITLDCCTVDDDDDDDDESPNTCSDVALSPPVVIIHPLISLEFVRW